MKYVNCFILATRPRGLLKGLISLIIRKIQKTDYSHYAIWVNDSVIDATSKGVMIHDKDAFYKKNKIMKIWAVGVLAYPSEIKHWANRFKNNKYGYAQLIGLLLIQLKIKKKNIFRNGKENIICNELVLRFLKRFKNVKIKQIDSFDLVKTERIIEEIC